MSTAEIKAKFSEKKLETDTKQVIPIKPTDQDINATVEEASIETLEIGSSLVETVELSSSSFMDHSSAKKAKLHFDVEDMLDEGGLESQTVLQPVADDLMIDWGSVCGICYRLVLQYNWLNCRILAATYLHVSSVYCHLSVSSNDAVTRRQ